MGRCPRRWARFLLLLGCPALLAGLAAAGEPAGSRQKTPDPGEVDRLIRQLGSDAFGKREAASAALERVGEPALDALRRAAADDEDPEVQLRADGLVLKIEDGLYREWHALRGHTRTVWGVALSPDGRRALSGSTDETLRLWDVATGAELRRLPGGSDGVLGVAFAPDGRRALAGGKDNVVRLWDVTTGQELRRLTGHKEDVRAVAFSPDGRRALSAGDDRTVRLWDLETGKELARLLGHTQEVVCVAFSPDGRRALSGGRDNSVRLWDVGSGREVLRFRRHAEPVRAVAFLPDGRRALSGSEDGTVRLWETGSGKELRCFSMPRPVRSLALSPDGRRALVGADGDEGVRVWDLEVGRERHRLRGHEEKVTSVAFSGDGRWAVSGSQDATVRLWRLPR